MGRGSQIGSEGGSEPAELELWPLGLQAWGQVGSHFLDSLTSRDETKEEREGQEGEEKKGGKRENKMEEDRGTRRSKIRGRSGGGGKKSPPLP